MSYTLHFSIHALSKTVVSSHRFVKSISSASMDFDWGFSFFGPHHSFTLGLMEMYFHLLSFATRFIFFLSVYPVEDWEYIWSGANPQRRGGKKVTVTSNILY